MVHSARDYAQPSQRCVGVPVHPSLRILVDRTANTRKEHSMFTRRGFAAMIAAGLTEAAFAQRAAVPGAAPADTVWLNGNEFPEGPPKESIEVMARAIHESNRYHYQEFPAFYGSLAASQGLRAEQILVGAGSSEILHAAVDAFTSPTIPFITPWPTSRAIASLRLR